MKPKRIFLIRHGESEGNIDKNVYRNKPDYAVLLTKKGTGQALEAGKEIKNTIESESYGIYYSPYFRTRQTKDCVLSIIDNNLSYNKDRLFQREEPRIREQEYSGRIRDFERFDFEKEIESFGKFFYRMDNGESPADCYDRVSDFIGTLHRDFEKIDYPQNILIFTHGMLMRVFIMRFFHITVEEFEMWKNPKNGEIYTLELQYNNKYKLLNKIEKHEKPFGWIYKYE